MWTWVLGFVWHSLGMSLKGGELLYSLRGAHVGKWRRRKEGLVFGPVSVDVKGIGESLLAKNN